MSTGRHPLPHGLVDGILERPAPRRHRAHLGAQQLHAEDVELLALGVDLAHEDGAFEAEECGGRGGGDAVLAGARLGDHASLAHSLGEQCLPHHIVELVRAGVRQVLSLEEDADAQTLGQARALGNRGRTSSVVAQETVQFGAEGRVRPGVVEPLLQLEAGRHQRLRDEAAAELAEPAVGRRVTHEALGFVTHASLQS